MKPWLRIVLLAAAPCFPLLTGCGPSQTASEEPLALSGQLSTNRCHIGDVLTLTLTAEYPADATLLLPDLQREDKSLIVRDTRVDTVPLGETRARSVYEIDFLSFVTGRHVVATNTVVLQTADGASLSQLFPFLDFEVLSILEEDSEVQGLKPLERWPASLWTWMLPLLALLVAAAALIAYLVIRRRRRPPAAPARPPVPADVLALQRLQRLIEKGYVERGLQEPFFVECSDIVRHYVEDRFDLHAPEQTTEEFLRTASRSQVLTQNQQERTAEFLEKSDLVKFARWTPGKDVMEAALDTARRLIVETRAHNGEEAAA